MKVKVIMTYKDLEPLKTKRNGKDIPVEEINELNGDKYFRAVKGDILTVNNKRGQTLIEKGVAELVEIEKKKLRGNNTLCKNEVLIFQRKMLSAHRTETKNNIWRWLNDRSTKKVL